MDKRSGQAGVDALTGLLDRDEFVRQATELIQEQAAAGEGVDVCAFDIENFNLFCSQFVSKHTDRILRKVAAIIDDSFDDGVVSHLYSDHFAVAVPHDEDLPDRIDRLQDDVYGCQPDKYAIVLKCGICTYVPDENGIDAAAALDHARMACAEIMNNFGVDYIYYDELMLRQAALRNHIVSDMDEALEQGYVHLRYQPIMDIEKVECCAFEALASWDDPTYGAITPGTFIKVLEKARQVHRVDEFVLRQVCSYQRGVIDCGVEPLPVSVNLSDLDFELCDMPELAREACEEAGIEPGLVCFEVADSALTAHSEKVLEGVKGLRELGHEVWIDDFGSGGATFGVLRDEHFDLFKVDMGSFDDVGDTDEGKRGQLIVESLINTAKSLGMRTLAKRVETESQYEFLREAGCDLAQGHLFGEPVPTDLDSLIEALGEPE